MDWRRVAWVGQMGLWTFSSRRPRTGLAPQEANSVQHTSHLTVNITQSQSWRHSFVIYHTPISSKAHISQVIALQPYISAALYVKGIYIYTTSHHQCDYFFIRSHFCKNPGRIRAKLKFCDVVVFLWFRDMFWALFCRLKNSSITLWTCT